MNTKLKQIENTILAYEADGLMREDSEIEIDIQDDEIWLCDYSKSRGGAEFIKKLGDTTEINVKEILKLCDDYDWYIVY